MRKFRRAGGLLAMAALAMVMLLAMENRSVTGAGTSSLENRLETVLSDVAGAGPVEVLVNEAEGGEIVGVCVLTRAADDVATVFRLQSAVRTALGIDNDRIEVIKMEENGR